MLPADEHEALAYLRTSVLNGCRTAHRNRTRRDRALLLAPDADGIVSAEESALVGEANREVASAGGRGASWLIPLGAAAVVVALALTLVALRHQEAISPASTAGGTSAPADAAAVAAIPRYYAIATEGPVSHDERAAIAVTVGDVRTGKTLATVTLPAVFTLEGTNSAVGVSAAGDDRTFVVGRRNTYGGITYFLVRIAPGAKKVATVEQLPIPDAALGNLLGFAVSPDGKELAVLSVRGNGTTLRTYSVKSGATLRTWIAGTWQYQGSGIQQAGVSWTADSRQVAFSTVVTTAHYSSNDALEERLIGATAPSGDLATASKAVLKAPGNCTSLLLTPDGGTVVCATQEHRGRIVRHHDAAVAADGDEAAGGAARGEFLVKGSLNRLGEIRGGVADPGGDVVSHDAADEGLAVSG